jgi:hypothetical protein
VAVGGGLAGSAALAGLFLLLLLKRKKEEVIEEEPEGCETTVATGTIDDDPNFISEYGLSDSLSFIESDDRPSDAPRAFSGGWSDND